VKKKNTKLSDKQERFCTEYLIDLNASSAAIRAGYSANGINKRVTRMMANEGIQIRISELQAKTSAKLEIKKEDNLKILRTIRDADLTRFMQFNGSRLTFTSFANIPKELMICVKSVKENVDKSGNHTFEVAFYDRLKAIETINNMLGFNEAKKISIDNPAEQKLVELFAKLDEKI